MKKTITINLNGILYTIDEDACALLEEYLHKIKLTSTKRLTGMR